MLRVRVRVRVRVRLSTLVCNTTIDIKILLKQDYFFLGRNITMGLGFVIFRLV